VDGRALTCEAFRYLTPKRRLEFSDLLPEMLSSRSFHLICSAARCIAQVEGIMRRRRDELGLEKAQRPLFIWEPVPYVFYTPRFWAIPDHRLTNIVHG
jgi:hypothetical protein